MNKKTSIEIDGKDVVLNYGANYFYEFFKEDSGQDLIEKPEIDVQSLQSTKLFSFTQSLVWSGYQCECAVNRVDPDFNRQDIKHLVMSKNDTEVVALLYKLIACMSGMSVEEIKNAETQAAKV